MKKQDKEIAVQSRLMHKYNYAYSKELQAFADLIRADEREFIAAKWENLYGYDKQGVAEFIRKRANTQGEQHDDTLVSPLH